MVEPKLIGIDDEVKKVEEGPIRIIDPVQVPKEPSKILEGFEWVTMDLTTDKEVRVTLAPL